MKRINHKTDVFKAIVDPTRRRILDALGSGQLSVSQIGELFPITQGAISQHLGVLRKSGLVTVKRSGRQRLYTANPQPLLEVLSWLENYHRFWPKRLDMLSQTLQKMESDET